MNLSAVEGREIIWGESDRYAVVEDKIVSKDRWSIHKQIVFRDRTTDKFYRMDYSEGATEYQDEYPFKYEDPKPVEVRAVEKVVIVYEPVS